MRRDVRLQGQHGLRLQVPVASRTQAYRVFHPPRPYEGVGQGARGPVAALVSEEDCSSKLHCGCCRKPLSQCDFKALNKGATYWVCNGCDKELRARARRGQASTEVWRCPTAAKGWRDCKCWCADGKKQQVGGGKRPKSKGFLSLKERKWDAQRNEFQEGDQ